MMTQGLKDRHPTALLLAEDSTAYPGVTKPLEQDGLGFDYKWDLGWMHDTLEYFQTPPDERPLYRGKLLFSMQYFPNEHYLLPLSHDEVVHGKAAIVQKMWGADLTDKYAQARAFYLYMFAHPGKKLNFMGNELGLRTEWSEAGELDWTYENGPFHTFFRALCAAYRAHPALHVDYAPDSFRWCEPDPDAPCVFAFERRSADETLLAVCNFADEVYTFDAPRGAELVLHTAWPQFGGNPDADAPAGDALTLPAFSAALLRLAPSEHA